MTIPIDPRETPARESKEIGDYVRYIDDNNEDRPAIAWTRTPDKEGNIDVIPLDTLVEIITTSRVLPIGVVPISVPSYRVSGAAPYWAE